VGIPQHLTPFIRNLNCTAPISSYLLASLFLGADFVSDIFVLGLNLDTPSTLLSTFPPGLIAIGCLLFWLSSIIYYPFFRYFDFAVAVGLVVGLV